MSEFKGTKGKWQVNSYGDISVGYEEIAYLRSSTENIERRSNAQLIAHAPEMLEMLMLIENSLRRGYITDKNKLGTIQQLN